MPVGLRRLLPLAISFSLIAGLGATPVAAQDEVTTAAGINADRVDSLHAIRSTGKKNKRRSKLMAFSAAGYLPANIIKGVAATLAQLGSTAGAVNEADNPVQWNQVQGVPPTISDGVDDVGYVSANLGTVTYPGGGFLVYADTPVGTDLELTLIPTAGVTLEATLLAFTRGPAVVGPYPAVAENMLRVWYSVSGSSPAAPQSFQVRARVYNTGIAAAALETAARKIELGFGKKVPKAFR